MDLLSALRLPTERRLAFLLLGTSQYVWYVCMYVVLYVRPQ